MKYPFVLLFLLFTIILSAQIGREFNKDKVNRNVAQITEKDYENVKLDKNGTPILPKKAIRETVHFYEDGYRVEAQYFDLEKKKKELYSRVLLKRKGTAVHSVEIYTYSFGKESLLRKHEAVIKDGKLFSEKISNSTKEMGSAQYFYGKTKKGLDFEVIDLKNYNRKVKYYTESDEYGKVFSTQLNGTDTVMLLHLLERQGDTLSTWLLIHRKRNSSPDSIKLTERKWLDANDNLILHLMQFDALTEPPPGEPESANFASAFSNHYNKDIVKKANVFPKKETLFGPWRSEVNNLELFFEPESVNGKPRFYGSSYLSKSNEPTVEEYMAAGEIWKYILKQGLGRGTWSFNEDGEIIIRLKNGSTLLFTAEMDLNTLVLKPKMKGMEGVLRLVKAG